MRTTQGKSRIIGVNLGKAAINVMHPGIPPLTAEFALVRDDDEFAGLVERRMEWNEKTLNALAALREAMEEDMMELLFEMPPSSSGEAEPEQV